MPKICDMKGVRASESNSDPVELWRDGDTGRLVVKAFYDCGAGCVDIDLWDLLDWLGGKKESVSFLSRGEDDERNRAYPVITHRRYGLMRSLSPAQKDRLVQVARGELLFRSPFNSTDYALQDRGLVSLKHARERSAGPAYYTDHFCRAITAEGSALLATVKGE